MQKTIWRGQGVWLVLLAGVLSCGVSACSEEDGDSCSVRVLTRQATSRFQAGRTFYLPVVEAKSGCSATQWSLVSAPDGSTNAVRAEDSARAQFTPVVPGSYTFKLGDTKVTQALEVVAPDTLSFHNLNYYPTRSVALVDGEVWTANVYAPSISTLDSALKPGASITTGSWPVALGWRAGLDVVAVAQRGDDTLGLVDVKTRTLVDSVWVGDEPANVVVHPTEPWAFVVLATTGEVVAVDLAERRVVSRAKVIRDPSAMAISPDGALVAVAAYRSGQTDRYPYEADPKEEEVDVVLLDARTLEVKQTLVDIGATLRGLEFSADGKTLYVAGTSNDVRANLGNPDEPSFKHEVIAFDAATGAEQKRVDLWRQEGSGGHAVQLYGMTVVGDGLWVVAEASDLAVELDASTLAERRRVAAPGRPRGITSDGASVYAHGAQGFQITRIKAADGAAETVEVGEEDPRGEALARGQRYFTGEGEGYGQNWSCNGCHTDGLTDTLVWNAGPIEDRVVSRPFFWLEGTYPLGWAGYLSSVRNYAFTVNTNVGVRPDTPTFEGLWTYLASLMPPPAATSTTERDGGLSEAGLRGKALYEGDAGCASCHALPMTTNRARFDEGITPGVSDVPALVGAYRHNVWMKHGESRTLRQAVVDTLAYLKNDRLSDAQIDDLTQYVAELTARDLFVLTTEPRADGDAIAADLPIKVTFSMPLWADPANAAKIRLLDASGEAVDAEVSISGRYATITPKAALAPEAKFTVSIEEGLQAEDETPLFAAETFAFTTAAAPTIKLDGEYVMVIDMPLLNFGTGKFDRENTAETEIDLVATATDSGASLALDYKEGLALTLRGVVSGDALTSEPVPIPIGPSFADSTGMRAATLTDEDGDGVADTASGTLTISGPGFEEAGVTWTLRRPAQGCTPKTKGSTPVEVMFNDAGYPTISWAAENKVLALFVTDSTARIPLGPSGTVRDGKTYLSMTSTTFPMGFAGPVTPEAPIPDGAEDTTTTHGGMMGGEPVPAGTCVKVYTLFEGFKITERIMER